MKYSSEQPPLTLSTPDQKGLGGVIDNFILTQDLSWQLGAAVRLQHTLRQALSERTTVAVSPDGMEFYTDTELLRSVMLHNPYPKINIGKYDGPGIDCHEGQTGPTMYNPEEHEIDDQFIFSGPLLAVVANGLLIVQDDRCCEIPKPAVLEYGGRDLSGIVMGSAVSIRPIPEAQ